MPPREQQGAQQEQPTLRDGRGRYLKGTRAPGRPFEPGQSGNPRGGQHGPAAALACYLEGEAALPACFQERLPSEVWDLLQSEGLGAALVVGMLAIALDPTVDTSDRIRAIDWCALRYDGPLVKQLHTANINLERREVIIVGVLPGDDGDPPFPPEVTDVEEAEEAARQEANQRRQEAMGMGESKDPPRSSGRRRKRAPGESNGAGNGSAG